MNLNDIIFIDSLPTLDLHGFDRNIGRVALLDFINDNIKMKKPFIVIIHGIRGHVLKDMVNQTLKQHKQVLEYKIYIFNPGCTVAHLKVDK